tara:strand:- start:496 stop:1746 length:1251 start_codon:yes stop_codon:yes gene_type:complete
MSLKNIVDKIAINDIKKNYYLTKDIMEEVSCFVKKEKLILYGGYALNLILPKNNKIYKYHTPADYDCYSHNPKEDAIKLAKILKRKKYRFLKVKMAVHENTYKVYVGMINIIDLTLIDKNIYDIFLKIHEDELSSRYLKYYKNTYIIAPISFLIRNLHYELARPKESYYRWEKIHTRLKLLSDNIINKKYNRKSNRYIKYPDDIMKCKKYLLKYLKKNKLPIIGMYALKFIKNIKNNNCCNNSEYSYLFQILSKNYTKDYKNILNIIKKHINLKKYKLKIMTKTDTSSSVDIFKNRHRIQLINKNNKLINLIEITKVKDNCFSVQNINNYTIGSFDTILCFLYSRYTAFLIGKYINPSRVNNALVDIENDISIYEKNLKNVKNKNRYKINCYGKELSQHKIYKKNWGKKMSLLKYS